MRAKFDAVHGKTRAVFTGADRQAVGKVIEVLTNLRVCEQVDADLTAMALKSARDLGTILGAYPAEPAEPISCQPDGNP